MRMRYNVERKHKFNNLKKQRTWARHIVAIVAVPAGNVGGPRVARLVTKLPWTPSFDGNVPVRRATRLGPHMVAPECASVNRIPCIATRSIFGVKISEASLKEDTSPYPRSSCRTINRLGLSSRKSWGGELETKRLTSSIVELWSMMVLLELCWISRSTVFVNTSQQLTSGLITSSFIESTAEPSM